MENVPVEETAVQNEYYENYPILDHAWLYIAIDIRNMDLCKIGFTTKGDPKKRIDQGKTYNPFLKLWTTYELSKCTFGQSKKELFDIERYMHRRAYFGKPLIHLDSRKNSEWFFIEPENAEWQMDYLLAKRGFSVDGATLFTLSEYPIAHSNVHIERMKKIKTIFRPDPEKFLSNAKACNFPKHLIEDYYQYLVDFYNSNQRTKLYL